MENNKERKNISLEDLEKSEFKTTKKTFVSDINPHLIRRNIQKEQYIWLGVYDHLSRNKLMIESIKRCTDTSLPLECAAIHLEKYKMSFNQNTTGVKAFIFDDEKSVVFLKLYLITKEQMLDVLRNEYGIVEGSTKLMSELKELSHIGKDIL
jgi:hypothetical protein